jgi:2-oxoglutarate ferredoxin oxidoreductase subunit gamma
MRMKQLNIRLCGFGGQGIILAAVILGTVAVTKGNKYAVQTQSYGSEARGGQCQAELIISGQPINSPITATKDILIALSQNALDRYISSLKPGGTLIIDPKLVSSVDTEKYRVIEVPATETAIKLGNRVAANMVVVGFIQQSTGLADRDDLIEVIKSHVPERFIELNLKAVDAGIELAKGTKISLEV